MSPMHRAASAPPPNHVAIQASFQIETAEGLLRACPVVTVSPSKREIWENFASLVEGEVEHAQEAVSTSAGNATEGAGATQRSRVSDESLVTPTDRSDPRRQALADHLLASRPDTANPLRMKQRPQPIPGPGTVFGLRRGVRDDLPPGEFRFELYDLKSGETVDSSPHGTYLFVNRADEPHVVRVALAEGRIGHTSLSYKRDLAPDVELVHGRVPDADTRDAHLVPVYYAGLTRLDHGEMLWFNNKSGHYLPPADKAYLAHAGTSWRRRLLPSHLADF